MDTIKDDLLAFIGRNFLVDPGIIDLDDSMIDQGIIDSFGLIEIVAFLEKSFAIKVGEDDVVRANFGSVHKIVDFVRRKQAEVAA